MLTRSPCPPPRAAQVMTAARAGIPEPLVSRRGWQRLLETAGRAPAGLRWSRLLIECRLDDPLSLADLSFQIGPPASCLPPRPAWLRTHLALGGLEYDSAKDARLAPSRFFTPAHVLEPSRPWEACRADTLRILARLRTWLRTGACAADAFAAADVAVRSLPEGCKVRQIGVMESRNPIGLRLCLSGFERLPGPRLNAWLNGTGYGQIATVLERSRDRLVPVSGHLDLAVDFPAASVNRAGWEIQLARRNPAAEAKWTLLLTLLDRYAPFRPGRKRALRAVYGYLRVPGWERAGDRTARFLVFNVNHFKLVFDARRGAAAKAYLSIVPYDKAVDVQDV